jgi:hypothetical protein
MVRAFAGIAGRMTACLSNASEDFDLGKGALSMTQRKVLSALAGLLMLAMIAALLSENAEAQRKRRRAAAASDISIDVCGKLFPSNGQKIPASATWTITGDLTGTHELRLLLIDKEGKLVAKPGISDMVVDNKVSAKTTQDQELIPGVYVAVAIATTTLEGSSSPKTEVYSCYYTIGK